MTHTPHDALVRAIFGQPHYAVGELRAAVPAALLAEMQLESLALVEGSFIDEKLRESSADLLFTVALQDGGSAFVYVLFEHQSTLDELMPLRLLKYKMRIWERFAAEHVDATQVPPIVPLLLHHGPKPWPWKPSFSSVMGVDDRQRATFGTALLAFDFFLDDLARQTDAEILGRASDAIVRLTLLSLRNGRSHPRLFELVADAMRAMREELTGPAIVPAIFRLTRYALEVGEESFEVVRAAFANALEPKDRSEVMVSTADMLRAEYGREILLEQVRVKFGPVDPLIRARIEKASLAELVVWTRRIVVATSLDEVFAS